MTKQNQPADARKDILLDQVMNSSASTAVLSGYKVFVAGAKG
jgi:hypothetical protein